MGPSSFGVLYVPRLKLRIVQNGIEFTRFARDENGVKQHLHCVNFYTSAEDLYWDTAGSFICTETNPLQTTFVHVLATRL